MVALPSMPVSALMVSILFFFSRRRRHTRCSRDWSSDVCSSDLSATNQRMEKILRALKESGDIEFAVVTVKTTGDQDIFDYSLAVARGWGIGSSEGEKNGLLLLVAIDDHKYQIQVSRHLEGDLPDGLVGEVGRRMRDPFRKGDYSNGLMTAVQTIVSTLEEKRGFSVGDIDKKYAYRPSAEPVRDTGRSFSPWL